VPVLARYLGAVDVQRAADLYTKGWTLRQIGTELGVPWTAVGYQHRRVGVTMRRSGPPHEPRRCASYLWVGAAARPRCRAQ
jgi:hypothetical protein